MRTDAVIDRQQVKCPKATTLGYGKWRAQVGDLIVYREGDNTRTARMIGRIVSAPNLNGGRPIRNFILAIAIDDMMRWTMERWIDPMDVISVESIRDQQIVIEYFLGPDICRAPLDEVRKAASDGWTTLAKYRAYMAQRAREQADFDARHPKGKCECRICKEPQA